MQKKMAQDKGLGDLSEKGGKSEDRHKLKDKITVRISAEKKELFKEACSIKGLTQNEVILYFIDQFIDQTY